MSTKDSVTLTKEEYEELLSYKQAFSDVMQIKKGAGPSYKKYKELKDKDNFMRKHYKTAYEAMLKAYEEIRLSGFEG